MLRLPKNIYLMSAVMSFCMASTSMMVLISGLLGSQIAPRPSLATLPMAMLIVSTALSTIPASLIMQKIGRKAGMLLSISIGMLGAVIGYLAAVSGDFNLLLLAALCLGFNIAFIQQGRFVILENADTENQQADGLTLALLSGLIAAIIGPQLGAAGKDFISSPNGYAGSFLLLLGTLACALFVMLFFKNQKTTQQKTPHTGRSLFDIVRQPKFILAAGSAAIGYGVMSLIMTATPVSMHDLDGHSITHTKWVIQSHIIAMFLPSIISGQLLKKGHRFHLIISGLLLYVLVSLIAFNGMQVVHYWWALLLLGIGWNFLFLASTSLLSETYNEQEKFKAQAANDFLVFTFQAVAAFSAGWLLFNLQWHGVLWIGLSLSVIWLLIVVILRTNTKT